MPEKTSNNPAQTFRVGALQCAIWKRQSKEGPFYNVTFSRSFKRKDSDEWEHTDSLNRDDLLVVKELAGWAFAWIIRVEKEARK